MRPTSQCDFFLHGRNEAHSLFPQNIRSLEKRNPALAERMASRPCTHSSLIIGEPSSKERPHRISLDRIKSHEASIKDQISRTDFRAEDATLIIGFGLGQHAEAIARHMEADHQLLLWEPVEDLFRQALGQRDLRQLLEHERVQVFTGPEIGPLYEALLYHTLRIVAGRLNKWVLPPPDDIYADTYACAEDALQKVLLHLRNSFAFLSENPLLLENILANALMLPTSCSSRHIQNSLSGIPAIVVSGGPSLSSNIDQIESAKGRLCLIAVDTAVKPLLQRGIKPDIIVSADPYELNVRKLEGISGLESIAFVFDLAVNPRIPKMFKGVKFTVGSEISLTKQLLQWVNFDETLGSAASSAHIAFLLARTMGANPIVFTGLDLSFPEGGSHHADGSALTWAPAADLAYEYVEGVHEATVKTIPSFVAMIGLFERLIAETETVCIDATEGGARIRGTEILTLAEVIDLYGPDQGLDFHARLEAAYKPPVRADISNLKNGLQTLKQEAQAVADAGRKALPMIDKARRLLFQKSVRAPAFLKVTKRLVELDRLLASQTLFEKLLLDFRAELVAFQYMQSYRIQRESNQRENLNLTLESMERSFRDGKILAEKTLSLLTAIELDALGCKH